MTSRAEGAGKAPRNRTYYDGDLRADLMATAAVAITESGVAGLSLRDVARRLGVSHAAPKNHFADKRALLTAMAVEAHHRLSHYFGRVATDEPEADPVDQVIALGRAYLTFAREQAPWFIVMWREDLQDREDPALLDASTKTFGPLLELTGLLSDGENDDREPVAFALLLWSCAHGLAELASSGAFDDLPGDRDSSTWQDTVLSLLRTLLRAAEPHPGHEGNSEGRAMPGAVGA